MSSFPKKKTGTPPAEGRGNIRRAKREQDGVPGRADLVDLNFKVAPEFRRRFRMQAASEDISNVALLRKLFDLYESSQQ